MVQKTIDNNIIALFFRVSSEQQVSKGDGLNNQIRIGRKLASNLGFEVEEFNEQVQSTHHSTIDDREVVLRLLKRIGDKKNPIRRVWVYNTDRLSRNTLEFNKIVQVFHKYDVKVYQGDSTTPKDLSSFTEKFMLEIFGTIASYDNALRRMRSNDGKRSSLLRGNTYIGGTIPFGFISEDKKLVFHERESKIVNELFKKYSLNESSIELKKWLDSLGDTKPRRSITWSLGTIQKMLKNKLYNGIQEWQWKEKLPNGEIKYIGEPIDVKVPKIVDDKTFKIVQSRISEINELRIRNNNIKNQSLLSGLLKCDKCKLQLSNRYRESIGLGNHYYGRCTEHQWRTNEKKITKNECSIQRSLRIEETDELILNTLIDLIKKSKQIREEYRTELLNQKETEFKKSTLKSNTLRKKIKGREKLIQPLENKIALTEVQIVTKEISKSLGEKIIILSKGEIYKITDSLEELKNQLSVLNDGSKWIDWIDKMSKNVGDIRNKSKDYQRKWIRKFIRSILVEFNTETKTHKLSVNFTAGLVDDSIKKVGKNENGLPIYNIIEGSKSLELNHQWVKRVENIDEEYISNTITEINNLKNKGLSYNEICVNLNDNGIKTSRGKDWKKDTLIKFRNKHNSVETIPK